MASPVDVPHDLRARAQTRTLRTLVAAQVAGGIGLASGITVAALIAIDLSAETAAAGLPEAASVAGTAIAAAPLAALMRRRGRRPGLRTGWLLGAAGALGVILAAAIGSLPLLLASMVLLGCANASSDAARHVAADLAPPAGAGRAIGTVVAATAVSTAIGPLLTGPMARVATAAGLPGLTGPFLLAAVGFTAAAVVVTVALRPDPLVLAAGPAVGSQPDGAPAEGRIPLRALLRRPGVPLAIGATAVANATMLVLMTMTPVHLSHGAGGHDAALGAIGVVVALHLAAMFAPSPVTGRLIDRVGATTVVAGGAAALAAGGLAAAAAGPADVGTVGGSLVLLGLGWNACFIGGASLLAVAVPPAARPRVQGAGDALAGVGAVAAGATSGALAGWLGYGVLGLLVAVAAGALLTAVHRSPRRPAWRHSGPGGAAVRVDTVAASR